MTDFETEPFDESNPTLRSGLVASPELVEDLKRHYKMAKLRSKPSFKSGYSSRVRPSLQLST